jgi:hypothetical protein
MSIPTQSHTGLHHDLRRRAPDILLEPCLMLDPSVPYCGVMVLLPAHDIVKDLCLLNGFVRFGCGIVRWKAVNALEGVSL